MSVVGITGSFASGKSFILELLKSIGFKVSSADELVRNLYNDPKIQQHVVELLIDLKKFDKTKIVEIIYKSEDDRIKLQNFIHPLVLKGIEEFKLENRHERIIFVEVPLLFEVGIRNNFDFVITTFCSEELRLERAKNRSGFTAHFYDQIQQIQLPQEEKIKMADFAINTGASKEGLILQLKEIISKIQ